VNKRKWVAIAELIDEDVDKNFDTAIDLMSTNKNAQKACQYINRYDKNPQNYPQLMDRLKRKSVRYSLKDAGWELAEIRFANRLDLMVILAEDIFWDNKIDEAVYLVRKYNLWPQLAKKELRAHLAQIGFDQQWYTFFSFPKKQFL
jgi:hypothetical protein